MNFEKIRRTAISYWSDEDRCFVAQSAICSSAMGTGDTQEEAMSAFEDALARVKEDLEKEILADATNSGAEAVSSTDDDPTLVTKTLRLNRHTDRALFILRDKLGCSLDEAVDYLVLFYEHARLIDGPEKAKSAP
jgi:predicted RNase H-like HicB family nuclease